MVADTRAKILDAATLLFAASDSRGASLRAIAREAGVNSALIHYHFGSREGLFKAALLRALGAVQARRSAMLATLRAAATAPTAEQLARLFVEPLIPAEGDHATLERTQLRLLTRAHTEQHPLVEDLVREHFGESVIALELLLGEALPTLSEATRCQRMHFCVQTTLSTFSTAATDSPPVDRDLWEALVRDLIDFLAGGLGAPTQHPAPSSDRLHMHYSHEP